MRGGDEGRCKGEAASGVRGRGGEGRGRGTCKRGARGSPTLPIVRGM